MDRDFRIGPVNDEAFTVKRQPMAEPITADCPEFKPEPIKSGLFVPEIADNPLREMPKKMFTKEKPNPVRKVISKKQPFMTEALDILDSTMY